MKKFTCPFCDETSIELDGMHDHIEEEHETNIPENITINEFYYTHRTGKTHGNCVMCKRPTKWNETTNKFNRFCGREECKDQYVVEVRKRMVGKYGKTTLLNDPEHQKKMLKNRSISGTYKWSDNKHETDYTGSYEKDFLQYLDIFLDADPTDVMMPSPHTYYYKYEGKEHFYIPDAFIPSLNLEIEIKDGGDNPNMHHKIQDVDKVKERLKDEVMTSQKERSYIKIVNKEYSTFIQFLLMKKDEFSETGNKDKPIFILEKIKTYTIDDVTESALLEATNSFAHQFVLQQERIARYARMSYELDEERKSYDEYNCEDPLDYRAFNYANNYCNASRENVDRKSYNCKYSLFGIYYDQIANTFADYLSDAMDCTRVEAEKSYNKLILNINMIHDYRDKSQYVNLTLERDLIAIVSIMQKIMNYTMSNIDHSDIFIDLYENILGTYSRKLMLTTEEGELTLESALMEAEGSVMEKSGLSKMNLANYHYKLNEWISGENKVLVVTGQSGTGKSTVSRELSSLYRCEHLELDGLYFDNDVNDFTSDFKKELQEKYPKTFSKNKKDFDVIDEINTIALNELIKLNTRIIVDTHFAFTDHFMNIVKNEDVSVMIIRKNLMVSSIRSNLRDKKEFKPISSHGKMVKFLKGVQSNYQYNKSVEKDFINMIDTIDGFAVQESMGDITLKEIENEKLTGSYHLYHLSEHDIDGKVLTPRIPDNFLVNQGYEDSETKRVSLTPSIDGCLIGIGQNLKDKVLNVYEPENYRSLKLRKPTKKEVPDSHITGEMWSLAPVKLKKIGQIKVGQAYNQPYKYTYGDVPHTGETYGWNYQHVSTPVTESFVSKSNRTYHPVYVLLTHTGTVLSNTIKKITDNPYSHSSISFSPELDEMYSFGRKYKSNPLIGTFVRENIKEGLFEDVSETATYSLYVTFVDELSYRRMKKRLNEFKDPKKKFRYNFVGLIKHQMGIASTSTDAYFCSQFVDTILNENEIDFFAKDPSLVKPYDFAQHDSFLHVSRGKLKNYDVDKVKDKVKQLEFDARNKEEYNH